MAAWVRCTAPLALSLSDSGPALVPWNMKTDEGSSKAE